MVPRCNSDLVKNLPGLEIYMFGSEGFIKTAGAVHIAQDHDSHSQFSASPVSPDPVYFAIAGYAHTRRCQYTPSLMSSLFQIVATISFSAVSFSTYAIKPRIT
jgi:hypothetical protein